jgi:SAM-dependent methyltransferase
VTPRPPARPALPSRALCVAQAERLAPARSRLLRLADVARRRAVLDLGCGWGAVTGELCRRARGSVVALDLAREAVSAVDATPRRVVADATRLPFRDGAFDLVFAQCVLTWIEEKPRAVAEIARVLAPGGAAALIEPDHAGLMEDPDATALRDAWLSALSRAGADPTTGRRLPRLLAQAGLAVAALLTDRPEPPDATRFALLEELPLCADERARVAAARAAEAALAVPPTAHLPFWLVVGVKGSRPLHLLRVGVRRGDAEGRAWPSSQEGCPGVGPRSARVKAAPARRAAPAVAPATCGLLVRTASGARPSGGGG